MHNDGFENFYRRHCYKIRSPRPDVDGLQIAIYGTDADALKEAQEWLSKEDAINQGASIEEVKEDG